MELNRYLFITHVTPSAKRSDLRQGLFDLYKKALHKQQYENWTALLLGEENRTEGKLRYVSLSDGTPEQKFDEIRKIFHSGEIRNLLNEIDYIVKLDDDDLISPHALRMFSDQSFDCCFDQFHTFLDLATGRLTQQKREWIASTCIHKKEHALAPYTGPGSSPVGNLLYSDHSASWHNYYRNKNCITADKTEPLYVRVLSPTSITGSKNNKSVKEFADISFEKYKEYLSKFGKWKAADVKWMAAYVSELERCWAGFSAKEWQNHKTGNFVSRLFKKNRTA